MTQIDHDADSPSDPELETVPDLEVDGEAAEQVSGGDMHFTKTTDQSSPNLFLGSSSPPPTH